MSMHPPYPIGQMVEIDNLKSDQEIKRQMAEINVAKQSLAQANNMSGTQYAAGTVGTFRAEKSRSIGMEVDQMFRAELASHVRSLDALQFILERSRDISNRDLEHAIAILQTEVNQRIKARLGVEQTIPKNPR